VRGPDRPVAPGSAEQLAALALANVRFWSNVAPVVRRELERWRTQAHKIPDPELRELALAKLDEEAFNAEVAATLTTLAPRAWRAVAVKAIVALEVLFDYLDGRTEALLAVPEHDVQAALAEGRTLSASLRAVIDGEPPPLDGGDAAYLKELSRYGNEHASRLPGLATVTAAALSAASRCTEAQLRLHASGALGHEQLRNWGEQECDGSGLGWREYIGGCASSVLAMHALIASAARTQGTAHDAEELNDAYLAIGGVITMLDSLVDEPPDGAQGESGYIELYRDRVEVQQSLSTLLDTALERTGRLERGGHHAMTLAGVAAYYTTHPGASDPANRDVVRAVRRALSPTIWPAVGVLGSWRGAKRIRRALCRSRADEERGEQLSAEG
jgi:tetraprenyl-beta-curcumene synthase